MSYKYIILLSLVLFFGCNNHKNSSEDKCRTEINLLLDNWHHLAAIADTGFFDRIAGDGIYIGTAAEEVWTKQEFVDFAKPYFENGEAWDFKPYDRNIYFSKNTDVAWFNEKLNTWMGVCRGSGVLQMTKRGWKIYQYTLSVAVPNKKIKDVVSIIK
jgi:hypothetical protein